MFYYDSNSTYIIPGADNLVTLGGSRDFESWDLDVCTHQASLIRDRCENLIPSIKKSKHKKYVVGLRPYRNGSVRVDYEMITNYSGKKATVSWTKLNLMDLKHNFLLIDHSQLRTRGIRGVHGTGNVEICYHTR